MADGSRGFNFPQPQTSRLRPGEIVVDLFAGGGGASEALKQALGIDPALAYNHDQWAIGMHSANHPLTIHHREDIWHADPVKDVAGRPVGWFHASPDCTHFSQAKGGQPRNGKIRALSWVVLKWVGQLDRHGNAPRIISMENVWQILTWGPLVAKRDKVTGRVLKMDGTVATVGERVPMNNQQLVPDKRHSGRTWAQFVEALRGFGYVVEWRKLVASDYGAGTRRERLFLIARRDGEPIVWPEPTHGNSKGLRPLVTAADCIDWSKQGKSIFNRRRPLARNSILRLLDGARRGHWPAHYIAALEDLRDGRTPDLRLTAEQAAEIQAYSARPLLMGIQGGATAKPVTGQVPTITTGGAGNRYRPGCARPQLFEPIIAPYYGNGSGKTGQPVSRPLPVVTTKGRFSVAEPVVVSTCNSNSRGVRLGSLPLGTITTAKGGDFAMAVPVAEELQIDILYRMLDAPELFRAQGFPAAYIINRTADGRPITTTVAVRMVGNSVSPPPLCALARANLDPAIAQYARAA